MKNNISQFELDTLKRVQVNVKDLKIGMYVSELDRPWLETNFWFQGFELKNQADIEAVQKQCDFVYIDTTVKTQVPRYESKTTPYTRDYLEHQRSSERRPKFNQEFKKAEFIHHKSSILVKSFMEEVKFGRPINVVAAKEAVANCVDSILTAPTALMLMTRLKNRDEYTAQHSMNVCIYAIALGRQLNLSNVDLNNVGMCGMMHDMGKMLVPLEVLNKPGRLTPEELTIMQNHTINGWQILINTVGMYAGAVDVAYMHHERLDGNGYPRKLRAEQITPFARMVAIADMYDAVSSDRVYQDGRPHLDAVKILTDASRNGHLDPGLTMKFIECMGIYPVGSLVELTTGEVGMVVEIYPKAKLKPKIMMLQDANKKPCNEFVIDLSMLSHNDNGQQYGIKKVMRPEDCGIDLFKYHKAGLLEKGLQRADV